jgi:enamine deaminase RidA (YjgF/YER057c/UK114 family)
MRLTKPIYQASISILLLLLIPGLESLHAESRAQYIDPDPTTGTSRAVLVRDTPLAHTSGLMPVDEHGKPMGQGEPATQATQVLKRLSSVLATVHSGVDQLVKLNVYAADAAAVSAAQSVIAGRLKGAAKPAVMFVVGDLPTGVSVAIDGVALAPRFRDKTRVSRFHVASVPGLPQAAQVSVMPATGGFYVSGSAAEIRDSVRTATFHTMENLQATLEHVGLNWDQVIQLRAFVNQASELATAEATMLSFFKSGMAPPVVVAPCVSPSPVEIEMIAASLPNQAGRNSGATIRHMSLPGVKPSPLYSKLVMQTGRATLYTEGLRSRGDMDSAAQIRDIFSQLGDLLKKGGSDFDHLVKATYFASDSTASRLFNEIRPEFLPAERPPAASKRLVKAIGTNNRTVTMDMIATCP